MGGLSNAHDGFGVGFSTTVAAILAILAITWGPWSQTDLLISEEENEERYTSSTDTWSTQGSEAVWGTEYLSKCPGCKKVSKLTMTRSPGDWCVTIKQLVFQPWERRRRMGDLLTTHTNYTTWENTTCLSEMEGNYLDDNFCNSTWKDLRKTACDKADAEIDSWPNATVYPYAFWRWVKLQCTMYDNVCAGTSNIVGIDAVGVVFMVLATITSLAGPFMGDKYKVMTIVTIAMLALGWIFILVAVVEYGTFNTSLNAPRDLYVKMLVHGEGTETTDIEATVFGRGIEYNDVRKAHYSSYPALKPPGTSVADYLDNVLESKSRWDWAAWTFSMGFFANVSSLMWSTVALALAIYTLMTLVKPAMKEKEIS